MVSVRKDYHFKKPCPHKFSEYGPVNATPNSNLRSLLSSRKGLKEHIKRASLQSGWSWKEGEKSAASQEPLEWG